MSTSITAHGTNKITFSKVHRVYVETTNTYTNYLDITTYDENGQALRLTIFVTPDCILEGELLK